MRLAADHRVRAHLGLSLQGGIRVTTEPARVVWFSFWFVLTALVVAGILGVGLRGTLTDGDRRAIEIMLDGATP